MTRTAPSSGVRLFLRRLFWRLRFIRYWRGRLRFRLRGGGVRRRLQQILIRLLGHWFWLRFRLLYRCGLCRTRLWLLVRLFRRPWARLLSLLLRVGPLLLLHLALALQRLLALFRRLFVPRYFVELCRLLTHISLHLRQQLALLIGQLIGVKHFATRRGFGRRTHARLTAFQLFDIAPAFFRFRRDAITGDFLALQRLGLFFLVMRNEVQTTDKGHEYGCSNSDHRGGYRWRTALLFP